MRIPRIFHRAWVGPNPIPDELETYWNGWQALHPDWQFVTWNDESIAELGLKNKAAYDASKYYAGKTDIAMHEILHRFGGVWLCCDMECFKNIDPLIDQCSAFAGLQPAVAHLPELLLGAIMGFVPGHPISAKLVDGIGRSTELATSLWEVAGPGYLTRTVSQYLGLSVQEMGTQNEFTLIPARYVYPFTWDKPFEGRDAYPEAYCCHHWRGSWGEVQGQ